jgi:hypothetical protein
VFDIFTEDNGLGEPVGGSKEFGDFGRDQFRPFFEDEVAVKVAVVVLAVVDDVAV